MKFLARLFTALFLCQTLLGFPAQAEVGHIYGRNQPLAQMGPAQAAINSEASDAGLIITDVASRAYFGVGGSFSGAITNVASDVAAGGALTYTPASVELLSYLGWC